MAEFNDVAFAITTSSGNDFSSPLSLVTLAGTGWINVRDIRLQGSDVPLAVTWAGSNVWSIQVPVSNGANPFTIEALNHQGAVTGADTITITGTGGIVAANDTNIVFSEVPPRPALRRSPPLH